MLCILTVKKTAFLYTLRIMGVNGVKRMNNEKDIILSDAVMCTVLKIEADAVGVSLEEYVNRFLKVFYDDPYRFKAIYAREFETHESP